MIRKTIDDLRSQRWFSARGSVGDHKRRRIKQAGFRLADFVKKRVIAILSTWSDLQPCHSHFPQRIEEVKRTVWQAGGFPVVIPVGIVTLAKNWRFLMGYAVTSRSLTR